MISLLWIDVDIFFRIIGPIEFRASKIYHSVQLIFIYCIKYLLYLWNLITMICKLMMTFLRSSSSVIYA